MSLTARPLEGCEGNTALGLAGPAVTAVADTGSPATSPASESP